MFREKMLKLILLTGALLGCNLAYSVDWEVLDVGTLETDRSDAHCVNDKGQVCGTCYFQGNSHCFIWEEGKGATCLDLPAGALPVKMNNLGQIVGTISKKHCFFWDPIEGVADIIGVEGKGISVTDINDLGQVVGRFQTVAGETHAFLWESGEIVDLGTLHGELCSRGNVSEATGINNDGVIVGYSNYALIHKGKTFNSPMRAVVWEKGKIRELAPQLDPKEDFKAIAINNLGCALVRSVSGAYEVDTNSGKISHCGYNQCRSATCINDELYILTCDSLIRSPRSNSSYNSGSNPCEFWRCVNTADSVWKTFQGGVDMNNSNWIIGTATNIYNETHAVLLRPIK